MAREIPFPDHCLIWTGSTQPAGLRKVGWDIVMTKPRARILGDKYLPRYLLEILHGPQRQFRCTCGNTLCINPAHWTFAANTPAPEEDPDIPVFNYTGNLPWTYEEAEEMVNLYLERNRRPLDPTHNLLIDIPPELLEQFQIRF